MIWRTLDTELKGHFRPAVLKVHVTDFWCTAGRAERLEEEDAPRDESQVCKYFG